MTCRFGNRIKRVMQQRCSNEGKDNNGEKERDEGRKSRRRGVGPSAREYAIRYAVIISQYKFLARSTWAVAFLLLSAADPFYWSAFRSSIMHLMQLGTYPRLNARALLSLSLSLSLSRSLIRAPLRRTIDRFPFRYPLTRRTRLAHDNEYGCLTGSPGVNEATPLRAVARRCFGVKISRYGRRMSGKFRTQP